MGPGERSADCGELFGEGFERQANMQTRFAGNVCAAGGTPGAADHRDCVALRGPEGVRFDGGKSARADERGFGAGCAGNGRQEIRKTVRGSGCDLLRARGTENRVRQYFGAQGGSGSGYVPDAVALRAVGLEPDVQLEIWYGADCKGHGRAGRQHPAV